jgi:hypothetical protein
LVTVSELRMVEEPNELKEPSTGACWLSKKRLKFVSFPDHLYDSHLSCHYMPVRTGRSQ